MLGSEPILLPFIEEEVVVQSLASDCHKINPYQMFEPLPARVTLTPAVDIWTEHRTSWASDFTERFTVTQNISRTIGSGNRSRTTSETSTSESTISRSEFIGTDRDELAFIRVRDVSFSIEGFGAGEILEEATFDGVDIANANALAGFPLAADEDGHIEGTLTIPDNIPAGAKEGAFTGKGGSQGAASYVGRGIIETQTWRNVFTTTVRRTITTTTRRWRSDPVAQSFMLREGRHITGLSVKFCSIGNRVNPVILQTRNTDNGFPAQSVIGEGVLEMSDVVAGEWTKLELSGQPFLAGATRFANVLMSDDGEHAVSIARLGGFDAQKQQHVSAQPYSVGVFFDGSLAEAWKPHHDKDLTFKLHAARFTSTYSEVPLGEITLVECSDLIVSCGFEEPATGCSVTIRMTRANGEIIRTRPGRPLRSSARVAGLGVRRDKEKGGPFWSWSNQTMGGIAGFRDLSAIILTTRTLKPISSTPNRSPPYIERLGGKYRVPREALPFGAMKVPPTIRCGGSIRCSVAETLSSKASSKA